MLHSLIISNGMDGRRTNACHDSLLQAADKGGHVPATLSSSMPSSLIFTAEHSAPAEEI